MIIFGLNMLCKIDDISVGRARTLASIDPGKGAWMNARHGLQLGIGMK